MIVTLRRRRRGRKRRSTYKESSSDFIGWEKIQQFTSKLEHFDVTYNEKNEGKILFFLFISYFLNDSFLIGLKYLLHETNKLIF